MAINLAKILAKNLAKFGKPIGIRSATLTVFTPGTRTPGAVSAGTNPTSVSYACKAFIDTYNRYQIEQSLVQADDRKISILGGTLPAGVMPKTGSTIAIADVDGTSRTFIVVGGAGPQGGYGVEADGVGAVYACQCRK